MDRPVTPASAEEKARALRKYCEEDLLFLFNEILIRALPPDYVKVDNAYFREFRDILNKRADNTLIEVSRDMMKTTVMSAFVIQEILRNPMIAITWGHGVQAMAIKKSLAIRRHFEMNKWLKAIAPDVCFENPEKEAEKWTEREWTVKRPYARPDMCTVMAFGMDSLPTSVHSDLVIFDDIEVYENTDTPEKVDKLVSSFNSFIPVLSSKARKVVVGTTWVLDGLMMRLREHKNYVQMIKPCWDKNGHSIWPEHWPDDKLKERLIEVGSEVAASQYLLAPLPSKSNIFKREYFEPRGTVPDGMPYHRFLYLDPEGYKPSGKGCESGFCSILWAEDKIRYIEEAYGISGGQKDIIDQVFMENEKNFLGDWDPSRGWQANKEYLAKNIERSRLRAGLGGLVVEVNMPTITQEIFNQEQVKRYGKVVIPVFEIKHTGDEHKVGQYSRIAKLQRYYAEKTIIHYPGLTGGALENQLLQYPKSSLWDVADAAAMMEDFGYYPKKKDKQPAHQPGAANLDRAYQKLMEKKNYGQRRSDRW
ncbi:MAG: hypothetical protein RDU76_06305 [Candidatus Edwardsbacteria bacterium]|nr:hypothetical protein [Candidatus Edwardsbacteria bacterium]